MPANQFKLQASPALIVWVKREALKLGITASQLIEEVLTSWRETVESESHDKE